MRMNVHIKLKVKGTKAQIAKFHAICKLIDSDWPYVTTLVEEPKPCAECGGRMFRLPRISPQVIAQAGRQAGLRSLKIKRFLSEDLCTKKS